MDDKKNYPKIDLSKMPESALEDFLRATDKAVTEYFKNITPEQQAHYEQWCKEYDRRKEGSNIPENID